MDQREIWDDLVGDAWVRNADIIDKHSAPFGEAAMERLGTVAGASVLDVGCGTGTTTRELASRGASAVGIDLSARMVAHARTLNAAGSGADFEVDDVTALAPAEPFDAVYSRFGVMFFDDAVAAFRHIRTVVRSGGRLGFCAWAGPFENPWMTTAVLASIPLLGVPEMPGPDEPGPFSLSTPERIQDVLVAAGWSDITVDPLALEAPHPAGDIESVATVLIDNVPPLAAGLARVPGAAAELHAAVVEALLPNERDGAVWLDASALIAGARA